VNGELSQGFDACPVFAESVFDDTEIEARDHDIVPPISDSSQRYIQHGHDLGAKRLVTIEGDRAKEFLAFRVARVVRAGIGLLLGQIDRSADSA